MLTSTSIMETVRVMADENKSKAGHARAAALSPERKKEIAKKAALSRWNKDLPQASYEGSFKIGDADIACAVLPNGSRIITQAAFLRAIGRSRSPKANTGVLSTVDELPFFLQADALKPFISEDLRMSTAPIFFLSNSGGKGVGYDARLLPQVADVYLKYRDHCLAEKGRVPKQYEHIVKASDILTRALANVGIIGLVDEATGYQRDRANNALAEILEKFIAKELRAWVKTFPDEFYEQLFRLRGLSYPNDKVTRPQYFGHLTNDIVYRRLAPKILEELKSLEKKDAKGRRKNKLFQNLTDEIGHPRLREHIAGVVPVMKLANSYDEFINMLDRTHPRFNETVDMGFSSSEDTSAPL